MQVNNTAFLGMFMDSLTLSQINLALQIAILIMLLTSLALKKRYKYLLHGITMLIAVILNTLSFLIVMLPSLLSLEIVRTQPTTQFSAVTLTHASLGAIAEILAIWLVASWHLNGPPQNCRKRKLTMRVTLILWLIVLWLGFVLYYYLYGF
jgi:uncharacterized membrane protein YozB (DUF420 family)